VVLCGSGADGGGIAFVATIGTWAGVVDCGQTPDGLLKIVAQGERRFRILGRDLQPDGLHLADVEWLDDTVEPPLEADEYPGLLRPALANRALAASRGAFDAGVAQAKALAARSGTLAQLRACLRA
jgi:Lon protease-like protein